MNTFRNNFEKEVLRALSTPFNIIFERMLGIRTVFGNLLGITLYDVGSLLCDSLFGRTPLSLNQH